MKNVSDDAMMWSFHCELLTLLQSIKSLLIFILVFVFLYLHILQCLALIRSIQNSVLLGGAKDEMMYLKHAYN